MKCCARRSIAGFLKLLAWLDQIQPSFAVNSLISPSYSLQLLADYIFRDQDALDPQEAILALIDTVRGSLDAEREHLLQAVNTLLDQTQEKLESQLEERMETVDAYFEGLTLEEEQPRHGE
jgi:hypothetical protein